MASTKPLNRRITVEAEVPSTYAASLNVFALTERIRTMDDFMLFYFGLNNWITFWTMPAARSGEIGDS